MTEQTKFLLDESKLPEAWYNINADMPTPPTSMVLLAGWVTMTTIWDGSRAMRRRCISRSFPISSPIMILK